MVEVVPKCTRGRPWKSRKLRASSPLFLVYLLAAPLFAPGPILLAHLIAPRIYGASREAISTGSRPRLGPAWIQGNVTKMGG